jgi:hypothetical protein
MPGPAQDHNDALNTLIQYCLHVKAAEVGQILAAARIDNTDYQNFRKGSNTHYAAISSFIRNTPLARLKQNNKIPAFIKPLILHCFPGFFGDKRIESPNDVFLEHADVSTRHRNDISNTYSGIFNVYRYSSHLKLKAAPLEIETSGDGKQSKEDPWMICAGLEVFPAIEHDEFVRFQLHYRAYEIADQTREISHIDGIIISINGLLYFVGVEKTRCPLVIISVAHPGEKIREFTGLILRYHEHGQTIASRVGFKRAPTSVKKIDDLDKNIGLERESKLINEIAVFNNRLINEIEYDGKSALVATFP